jgi:hypothetical protein
MASEHLGLKRKCIFNKINFRANAKMKIFVSPLQPVPVPFTGVPVPYFFNPDNIQ